MEEAPEGSLHYHSCQSRTTALQRWSILRTYSGIFNEGAKERELVDRRKTFRESQECGLLHTSEESPSVELSFCEGG